MSWIKKTFGRKNREKLIQSLERIYNDLKAKNPNKDEHWLLANTWLKRYENWDVSKQKGSKWTRDIAYRDTFQFSILDTPKSIRALVLFLVYKEFGEKEDEVNADEFNQIMELLQKVQGKGILLDEYKRKNPVTWKMIDTEKDEAISPKGVGLYGFLKATDHLDKNPAEMERAVKRIEDMDAGRTPEPNPNATELNLSKEQIEEIRKSIEEDK